MPGVEGKAAPLGKIRDTIHSHVFYGGHTAEMLNNCAEIQIGSRRFENGFQLDIGVSIRRIGHALPTGSPMRMVYLLVEVMNEQGLILWRNMENSPFEDERALFMRLLEDDRGNAPVPPWEAVSEKFDRRLMPDETRTLEYVIEDTTAYSVQASLYYRLAPVSLLDKLGIQDSHYYERKLITSNTARLE